MQDKRKFGKALLSFRQKGYDHFCEGYNREVTLLKNRSNEMDEEGILFLKNTLQSRSLDNIDEEGLLFLEFKGFVS